MAQDIECTVYVADWRDVEPDETSRRAEILADIRNTVLRAAEQAGEDNGIAVNVRFG